MRESIDDGDYFIDLLFLTLMSFLGDYHLSHLDFLMVQSNPFFKNLFMGDNVVLFQEDSEQVVIDVKVIDFEGKFFFVG